MRCPGNRRPVPFLRFHIEIKAHAYDFLARLVLGRDLFKGQRIIVEKSNSRYRSTLCFQRRHYCKRM
jgi:hypothetical protein